MARKKKERALRQAAERLAASHESPGGEEAAVKELVTVAVVAPLPITPETAKPTLTTPRRPRR
jgi:hypothetical protein